jgi:hypothetical protein
VSYDESLIQLVDQRIRLNQQQTRALGTCVNRDDVGPGCLVLFDGSTVAVPVKVLGHVMLLANQRCALERFGTEWIVVGAFEAPALGMARSYEFASTMNTSSGTYVDCDGLTPFTFVKYRDTTSVVINYSAMAFSNTTATGVRFALRFTQTEGDTPYTPVDYNGPAIFWSQVAHLSSCVEFGVGAAMPAGKYTAQQRWRRTAGAGDPSANSTDLFAIVVREYVTPDARSI